MTYKKGERNRTKVNFQIPILNYYLPSGKIEEEVNIIRETNNIVKIKLDF